ncbi:peptidase C54, partial [Jaminaea rosea]
SGLTTDAGWGCMLRTGQSLLANALVEVHLGRDWRPAYLASRRRQARYVELLSWFMDDPSSSCPFSVHRMAREGKRLGKEVGEWFGPSTAAGAIRKLVDEWPQAGLGVSTATDGVVYLNEVRRAAKAPSNSAGEKRARPVLILINVRLGLEGVHPTYYDSIRQLFTFPQSVGIAGGRPGSSYYFVGFQGGELLYLDPHHVRGRARTTWYLSAYSDAELSTYHCDRPRRMPVRSLDPSMLLGFLVDIDPDTGDIEPSLSDLASRVKSLPKPIFSLQEAMPRWMRDDDDDDDEFDEGD